MDKFNEAKEWSDKTKVAILLGHGTDKSLRDLLEEAIEHIDKMYEIFDADSAEAQRVIQEWQAKFDNWSHVAPALETRTWVEKPPLWYWRDEYFERFNGKEDNR